MAHSELQGVGRFIDDFSRYEKWLAYYLEQGFELATADELAYIKSCNNEEVSQEILA